MALTRGIQLFWVHIRWSCLLEVVVGRAFVRPKSIMIQLRGLSPWVIDYIRVPHDGYIFPGGPCTNIA